MQQRALVPPKEKHAKERRAQQRGGHGDENQPANAAPAAGSVRRLRLRVRHVRRAWLVAGSCYRSYEAMRSPRRSALKTHYPMCASLPRADSPTDSNPDRVSKLDTTNAKPGGTNHPSRPALRNCRRWPNLTQPWRSFRTNYRLASKPRWRSLRSTISQGFLHLSSDDTSGAKFK